MPKMWWRWLVFLLVTTCLLFLYHGLGPYWWSRFTMNRELPKNLSGLGQMKQWASSEEPKWSAIDSNAGRWRMRLQKKWELYYKMKQLEEDELDYVTDSGNSYASLSPRVLWDLGTLKDYFTAQPVCSETARAERLLLAIIITSAPQNFDQRRAIRDTWANPSTWNSSAEPQSNWKAIFLLGKASTDTLDMLIDNEMSDYGDILRGNYLDSYRNLTLKVLHGLDFVATSCRPEFVLKTDDDCFVNLSLLLTFLSRHNVHRKALYIGEVTRKNKNKVVRNPDSKWYVSRQSYPPEHYPSYPSGHGYILSSDLLDPLLDASTRFLPFPNEDAYVGVLMNAIGVRPSNTYRFTLYSHNWKPCNLLYLLVIHYVSPKGQRAMLDMAMTARKQCPGQAEVTTW